MTGAREMLGDRTFELLFAEKLEPWPMSNDASVLRNEIVRFSCEIEKVAARIEIASKFIDRRITCMLAVLQKRTVRVSIFAFRLIRFVLLK